MKKIDLTGQKFGRLIVIEDDGTRTKGKQVKWRCRCECGNLKHVKGSHLKDGRIKSCGCLNDEKRRERYKDMSGFSNKAFDVLERDHSDNQRVYWRCKCKKCGEEVVLNTNQIHNYKSCGCDQHPSRGEFLDKIRDPEAKWDDGMYANNTSGVRGVYYNKRKNSWIAHIGAKGEKYYLGSYKEKSEAIKARKAAEKKYWK